MVLDPALVVQRATPGNLAIVTGPGTDGAYPISFRGRDLTAISAGGNQLLEGDQCAFIDMGSVKFVIKASAGYPTRWVRKISDWRGCPAAIFLKYILRNNPKRSDYKIGTAISIVSPWTSILRVQCWDGINRDLRVEYAGEEKSASIFEAGEPVLCYWKNSTEWVVIGRNVMLTISPDPIEAINMATVTVTQDGGTDPITVVPPSPISVSPSTLPAVGGSVNMWISSVLNYTRCAAGKIAFNSGGVTALANVFLINAGFPASFGNYPVGQSSYIHNMQIVISDIATTLTVTMPEHFEIAPSLSGPWSSSATISASGYLFFRFSPLSIGPKNGEASITFGGLRFNPTLSGLCRSASGTFRYRYGSTYVETAISCVDEAGTSYETGYLPWGDDPAKYVDCSFDGSGWGYTVKIEIWSAKVDGSETGVVGSDTNSLASTGETVSLSAGPHYPVSGWRVWCKIIVTPD